MNKNLELQIYPSSVLYEKAEFIDHNEFGAEKLFDEINQMFTIMKNGNGIGLAANQANLINENDSKVKHIFVVDLTSESQPNSDFVAFDLNDNEKPVSNKKLAIINSKIEWSSKEMHASEEGCLSLPKISVWVNRPKEIKLRFFDEHGKEYFWKMQSLLAKCCQHEIDHLNGKMIFEYKNFICNTQANKKKIDDLLLKLKERNS
jgi:peptide deformylase